ncbi:hypothetical protein QQ045_007515 [Rhodiola kirilowii]
MSLTGFALFELESLKWPGLVEFDDVNGEVFTYSAQDRFVEFVDCCCAGGFGQREKSEDQIGVMHVCKDIHLMHPIHFETLAKISPIMRLYSGILTEVAMVSEPKWLSEDDGNLVLVPLGGGLIELFAA